MDYAAHVFIMVGIYSLAVLGLRIATCYGAQLVVIPTVAFAAGAYSVGILAGSYAWPSVFSAIIGVLLGVLVGAVSGLLTLRLDGDYLLLAALGTCEITRSVITNLDSVTGGSIGIMNIPSLVEGLQPRTTQLIVLVTVFVALGVCCWFSQALRRSLFGLIQVAIREDAVGTASLGHAVRRTRVLSVAIGSGWAALGGALFAAYSSYVDPSSFTVDEAIMMFAMFVLGGMRSVVGTLFGVTVFLSLPEILRLFGIPSEVASPLRRVFCGVLLLAVMRARLIGNCLSAMKGPAAVTSLPGGEV